MIKLSKPSLSCALIFLLSACAGIQSGSECYIEESALSGYSSFGWRDSSPLLVYDDSQTISPLMTSEIKNQVRSAFERAGYEFQGLGEYTDFYVSIVISTQQVVDETIYFPGRYHQINDPVIEKRERVKTTGFVAVDVFDGETGEPRWRGWAQRPLRLDDRRDSREAVEDIVRSIMVEFPTKQ